MEIYIHKSALSTQLADPTFQFYHATVKAEELYTIPEELVAWYPTGGFVSRDDTAPPFGKGVIVVTAQFFCKTGMMERVLKALQFVPLN